MNGGGKEGPTDSNRIDVILMVLSHPVRRDVIQCLSEFEGETLTLDELAKELMARRDQPGYEDERRVKIRLRHIHVPKLAECRIVEYDPREGRVRYRSEPFLETLLDDVQEWEDN